MTIKEISKPIINHLDEFDGFFKSLMQTDVALLNLVLRYITKKKGKQVRPVLVFLSAGLCGDISKRTYIGASMVELLHTATLIHDDVVDQASERRGMASINVSWNNKIAVLVGDYLLSKGLLASTDNNETQFLGVTSKAVKRMSEGELLAIDKSKSFDIDEKTYMRIISDKTASLMSTCCHIGAISTTDSVEIQTNLANYGEYVGIAFQLKDDLFDYQTKSSIIGKPVGNDLREKKITLPLIESFKNADKSDTKKVTSLIKNGKLSNSDISLIVDYAKANGGVDYTIKMSHLFAEKAQQEISSLPESVYKNSLYNFSDYVVNRAK